MTLRATGQVLGVLGVCATITVCVLYVTKSKAQSTKEGLSLSQIKSVRIDGAVRQAQVDLRCARRTE
jgi:hypothetical protein